MKKDLDNLNSQELRELMDNEVRHLENELRLTREEYEQSASRYFELYSSLEGIVEERTSELRDLQHVLELKGQELEIMIDASPAMIYYIDPERHFMRINRAFSDFFSVSIRCVTGKRASDLFPENISYLFSRDEEVINSGLPLLSRQEKLETENSVYHLRIDTMPYKNGDGDVVGVIGFILDITHEVEGEIEKEQMRERAVRAEKMEAVGLLAGGVAHDGNNILTAMSGNLELLLADTPEEDGRRLYIEACFDATLQMEQLTNDLLTITRTGTVSGDCNLDVICLNEVVLKFSRSSVFLDLGRKAPNVDIFFEPDNNLLNIRGATHSLRKVIMNLVKNAIEAMPDSGEINISTENCYLDTPRTAYDLTISEGEYCILRIADNGKGMDEESLNHIFEPFYSKKKLGSSGSGLGMTVVFGVVKNHHGFVDVKSVPGEGTVFELYFPIMRIVQGDKLLEAIENFEGHEEQILVIDDIEAQQKLLKEFLSHLNYKVDTVSNGEMALQYLKNNKPALIILDMVLQEGMDGLDIYKEVLKIHPDQKTIISSGYSASGRVLEAQELGAGEYIRKPYSFLTIGKAVFNALKSD